MEKIIPFNIWVCNRADGKTSFGEYTCCKRRVFFVASGKADMLSLAQILARANCGRPYAFRGDPLPRGWKTALRSWQEGYYFKLAR